MKPEMKRSRGRFLARRGKRPPAKGYAVPFFVALFTLTVIAFVIPLRPTRSYDEKRDLAQFPEFSVEALFSGDYFDGITLWFSDTFPGRDEWISLAGKTKELHGVQDVVIHGDISVQETIPDEYVPDFEETRPSEADPTVTDPEDTEPENTEPPETTPPTTPVEEWGGIDAGAGVDIHLGSVIQIGNMAFNYFTFSQQESNRFINTMTWFSEAMEKYDNVQVASVLIPTSVGVMVESEYQKKIGCTDQGKAIEYIHSGLPEKVLKVNVFDTLVEHNNEYIYFRTDHHWTALGAYYAYVETCNALGIEPTPLEDFEVMEQGTFRGSNYYKCNQSNKLELDDVVAYKPKADIDMIIHGQNGRFHQPMLTDMSKSKQNAKYMVFLAGDHPLCEITNNDIPEGSSCLIIKDSYGNCLAPFFASNYHKVYVVDFRQYRTMNAKEFVRKYKIDDVLFTIPIDQVQSKSYNNLIRTTCGF